MRNIRKVLFLIKLQIVLVGYCYAQDISPLPDAQANTLVADDNKPPENKASVSEAVESESAPDEDEKADEPDSDAETKPAAPVLPNPAEKSNNDKIVEGKALLEIIINGENLGAQLVNLKKDDVLVPASVFKDWRIKKELWASQTDNVSLRSLAPNLQYSVDNNNAALTVAVVPDGFERQVIETQSQYKDTVPADAIPPAPWSAYINYALTGNFISPQGFSSLNAPWEVGVTLGDLFVFSNFNTNYISQSKAFTTTRNTSYVQWENRETREKLIFGDFSISQPTLASSGNFGGILWQSNFRQYGQFQSMPSLGLDFNVQTPSHAELYVNNIKTQSWDLQPGMVSLPSVLTSGQGNATLVLTDAFGRRQEISQAFYITQQLLKEGLHEFFYGAGAKHNFSNKMFDYGDGVLFGAHRYGFDDTLTIGGAFTVDKRITNAGLSWTKSLWGNVLVDSSVAMSYQNGLFGYTGTSSYQFNFNPINLSINTAYISRDYGNLNVEAASLQKSKQRFQASLNYNLSYTGSSLGASFSQVTSWSSPTSKNASLFFRQSLFSSLNLNLQVNHDLTTGNNVFMATLNYFPHGSSDDSSVFNNNNFSYQGSYDQSTHANTQTWQTQRQGNIGEGYNYSLALQKQEQNFSGNARYQYQNNDGIFTANYAQTEQGKSGSASIAGSILTVNNEIYFARPITDSLAVVKVKGTEDEIPVYSNGARLGWANDDKAVIIPNVQSRRVNKVSVKPEDIGLAMEVDRPEQLLDVGVRTASVVEFTLNQFVAAEGNAYVLNKDGSKQFLEALPLEYSAKGKAQESFIAKKGFFYLENVPTGDFQATVKRYKHDCILHFNIPKSDKIVVKLGDVLCE
jgi:outer membrane usher protein